MMDNSTVVSEWKESFSLSQPTSSSRFGGISFLVDQATNCLLTNLVCNLYETVQRKSSEISKQGPE